MPNTSQFPFPVVFEDDSTIAINKPAGLASVPKSETDTESENAESLVRTHFPEGRAVHRLDTDTSGVLLFAKSTAEFERLRTLWNTPTVTKIYRALAVMAADHALPPTLTYPIAHSAKSAKRMVAITEAMAGHRLSTSIRGTPRPAVTEILGVEPIGPFQGTPTEGGILADVRLRIVTGVRHQIRVHLKAAGASLLGDPLYSKAQASRLYLHAWTLEWPRADGEICKAEAPVPNDWFEPVV